MKTDIIPRLFVFLYLFISFSEVFAAPCYTPVDQQALPNQLNQSGSQRRILDLQPKAKQFIMWLEDHAVYDKICFYSGNTGSMPIFKKMDTFQTSFGCQWIGSLLKLAGITDEDTKDWQNPVEWAEASRALAKNARHDAIVVLGETWKETGVWNTVELPTLKALKSVGLVSSIRRYTMKDEAGKLEGPVEIEA